MNEGKKICMFCGHGCVYGKAILESKLKCIIRKLVENGNVDTFYSSGIGDFDMLCEKYVRDLQKRHSDIKLCLIIPHITKDIMNDFYKYNRMYDKIIFTDMEKRYNNDPTINKNMWMVNNSDCMLVYVFRKSGMDRDTLRYGIKKNKPIIDVTYTQNYC